MNFSKPSTFHTKITQSLDEILFVHILAFPYMQFSRHGSFYINADHRPHYLLHRCFYHFILRSGICSHTQDSCTNVINQNRVQVTIRRHLQSLGIWNQYLKFMYLSTVVSIIFTRFELLKPQLPSGFQNHVVAENFINLIFFFLL